MSAIFEHKKLVADSQDLEFVYELLIEIVDYVVALPSPRPDQLAWRSKLPFSKYLLFLKFECSNGVAGLQTSDLALMRPNESAEANLKFRVFF